jgi:hypothetical protein
LALFFIFSYKYQRNIKPAYTQLTLKTAVEQFYETIYQIFIKFPINFGKNIAIKYFFYYGNIFETVHQLIWIF